MVVYPVSRRSRTDPGLTVLQVVFTLVGGATLFVILMSLLVLAASVAYAGQIYPGVAVAGIDLSGSTKEQAAMRLAAGLTYPQTGKIVLQDGVQNWPVRPADLGLAVDLPATVEAAYRLGRSANPLKGLSNRISAWHSGKNLSPQLVYDERLAQDTIRRIASQVDRPTVEASLSVNGAQVVAVPGQVGRSVEVDATLAALRQQITTLTDGVVPVVVHETPPDILDASQQAEVARQMLSAPLVFSIPDAKAGDPIPWSIPPDQLAGMLAIERTQGSAGAGYQVRLKEEALYTYLEAVAGSVNRQPGNPRFMFNDETRQLEVIQPATIGRNLDIYSTIQDANQKLAQGQHNIPLKLAYTQPEITDAATGEQLGITELVGAYTTYFRGSSAERLQNIQTAAANFHGLLVPPGAVFSMASVMGTVSQDNGYAEAWIIYGGRTIKGVGGGVCQVSTTLFRTAFFAGYPIVERYSHAYRVGYYEQTASGWDENLAGLDATVFVPVVDFKFTNNTPYWLLMETYFRPNQRSLTWKFYSTSDGRTVEWQSSGPQNIVDPPDPVYEENPDLAQGVIEQVDWAAEGADVSVTRTVYRNGEVLFSDTFNTHYMPWADVYQYGPGTQLSNKKKKPQPIFNP
jgi:vancomycin resistance protein YoaR